MRLVLTHLDFISATADENFLTLEKALAKAEQLGATHMLTPEMALPGYAVFADGNGADWNRWDTMAAALGAAAARRGISLWLGTARHKNKKKYNALLVYNRTGDIEAEYYKRRIPAGSLESWADPGEDEVIVNDEIRIGAMICADAWHDVRAYLLSQSGLDTVFLPACWPLGCGGPPELAWKRSAYSANAPFVVCNQTGYCEELDCRPAQSAIVLPEEVQSSYNGAPALLMTEHTAKGWSDFMVIPWEDDDA